MTLARFLLVAVIATMCSFTRADDPIDPLFNPSTTFSLGPELSSVELSAPVYDGLHNAIMDDFTRLGMNEHASLDSFTDISSLPYEQGNAPTQNKRANIKPFDDASICGYEVQHFCPSLHARGAWAELAICLHDMYRRTPRSVETYNRFMSESHSTAFTPITSVTQLPLLSKKCRAGLSRSPVVQCMREIRDLCGMPQSAQHVMMCFEEHRARMGGECARTIDSFGAIRDRGHAEFTGHVVSDMANVETNEARPYKVVKEAGWGYYFENHPFVSYLIFILSALLIVLLVYLLFGDVATIKRKCFGIKEKEFAGRMIIPESDGDYADNFGDGDYDL